VTPTLWWQSSGVAALLEPASRTLFMSLLPVEVFRNHKAMLSAKLNPVRLDSEPHNPAGLAFSADVVNARDEFTERQGFLPAIGFHGLRIIRKTARAPWGVTLPKDTMY
jgi:hypothetical protein